MVAHHIGKANSSALAKITLSPEAQYLERKDVQTLAPAYALMWKELHKNKTLANIGETAGKSRRPVKRMLNMAAAGAKVHGVGRALRAIQEFQRKLQAEHDDVVALDWVTELK